MADESPAPEGAPAEPAEPAAEATPTPQEATERLPDDHPLVTAYQRVKDDLQTARDKVQEFEKANLTEDERRDEEHKAALTERDELARQNALLTAAIAHNLSEDDLELVGAHGTPEEIADRAKRLAERLSATPAGERRPDPTLGRTEGTAASPDQWLRDAARK